MILRFTSLFVALGMLPALGAAPAAADPSRSYALVPGSDYVVGCFGPCLCPILITSPLEGRFVLSPVNTDGTEILYDVTDIAWLARDNGGDLPVSGSGVYRLVGGSPRMHQMTLTLRVENQPDQIFDSGLVPGGDEFPAIRIQIASGGFFCWDTVFVIDAATTTVTDAAVLPPDGLGFAAAWPNPFTDHIALRVRAPTDDLLDVSVHDAAGRLVRSLARGRAVSAGVHPFEWDGRREDGSRVPAGYYLARASGRSGRAMRPIIHLP